MESRGFTVAAAESVAEGVEFAMESLPAYAVIDLRLDDGNGSEVVRDSASASRLSIVMLTGYGNTATAVAAKGRCCRLSAETGDADDITASLLETEALGPARPMSADRVRGSIFSGCSSSAAEMFRDGAPLKNAPPNLTAYPQ